MTSSLVGSEMCIRDRPSSASFKLVLRLPGCLRRATAARGAPATQKSSTVSYTHLTLPTICSV
eukprot:6064849-Prorocentrum_lima.AAC.1